MRLITFISKYESQAYAILRIVAGFLFLWHGSQKLFDFPPSSRIIELTPKILIGGTVEFFGGLFIMIGFLTRWSAFLSCGTMAFAYWMSHGTNALLPIVNRGELAMLYCFLFLFIWVRGAGIWSIDSIINSNKRHIRY